MTTPLSAADFQTQLLDFLDASPTPFHAVASLAAILDKAGFVRLKESDNWAMQPGGRYYVTRNDSSIIGFVYGTDGQPADGVRMVGAHTDSPCLRVKPNPELVSQGYYQLGVETYGGVLLNPWFDRDLSLAGRVTYRTDTGELRSAMIDFKRAVAVIPSLAIHLNRDANRGQEINAQTDIPPVLMQVEQDAKPDFRDIVVQQMQAQGIKGIGQVLDYELSFYDTQPAAVIGLQQEFIASARLDNLLSCFIGVQALLGADGSQSVLLVCNDHEEVGSRSACGAQGPMLADFLARLLPDTEQRLRAVRRSLMISADNAHGVHPNFAAKHDGNHGPLLNKGPVIKVNSNQSYATNSESAAVFRHCCEQAGVAVQSFVTRTDMGCGSTIGPITSAQVGVLTLDVGVPTFAMHSIRELAGSSDAHGMYRVMSYFFQATGNLLPVSQ